MLSVLEDAMARSVEATVADVSEAPRMQVPANLLDARADAADMYNLSRMSEEDARSVIPSVEAALGGLPLTVDAHSVAAAPLTVDANTVPAAPLVDCWGLGCSGNPAHSVDAHSVTAAPLTVPAAPLAVDAHSVDAHSVDAHSVDAHSVDAHSVTAVLAPPWRNPERAPSTAADTVPTTSLANDAPPTTAAQTSQETYDDITLIDGPHSPPSPNPHKPAEVWTDRDAPGPWSRRFMECGCALGRIAQTTAAQTSQEALTLDDAASGDTSIIEDIQQTLHNITQIGAGLVGMASGASIAAVRPPQQVPPAPQQVSPPPPANNAPPPIAGQAPLHVPACRAPQHVPPPGYVPPLGSAADTLRYWFPPSEVSTSTATAPQFCWGLGCRNPAADQCPRQACKKHCKACIISLLRNCTIVVGPSCSGLRSLIMLQ
jgi:hypothetical protein